MIQQLQSEYSELYSNVTYKVPKRTLPDLVADAKALVEELLHSASENPEYIPFVIQTIDSLPAIHEVILWMIQLDNFDGCYILFYFLDC